MRGKDRGQSAGYYIGIVFVGLFCISLGRAVADADNFPRFISPVGCSVPLECTIQNYVDARPGTGYRDYTCGTLSYERHKGTDFRVLSYDLYLKGVPVLAVADGIVLHQRSDASDGDYILKGDRAVYRQEAGNNVVIDHLNGWQTTYAHLKKGSVTVSSRDKVKVGDIIGIVGLSGKTEFPHLHFQMSYNKSLIDPFTGEKPSGCITPTKNSLWNLSDGNFFEYKSTGIVDVGFASQPPEQKLLAFHSEQKRISVSENPEFLVFWGELWGLKIADRLTLKFKDPKGEIITNQTILKNNQASFMYYNGMKRPKSGWINGTYTGKITLERLVNRKWQVIASSQKQQVLP